MRDLGKINLFYDLDGGVIIAKIDTIEASKYDELEGSGSSLATALVELIQNIEDVGE